MHFYHHIFIQSIQNVTFSNKIVLTFYILCFLLLSTILFIIFVSL
ncbi:hypothetical protein HMPREF1548_06723 [Clostridium sp. KLE 1755]|nr:hypothetical protein HMPREF1548_06723 [Clostridium sp. KLE 1755]